MNSLPPGPGNFKDAVVYAEDTGN